MEQDIRFVRVDGRRVAYATVGEGPLFVFGRRWVSHLEADWDDVDFRGFITELARSFRVVRFDRLGAGLSDRRLDRPLSLELDTRSLTAVLDVFDEERATLAGLSCGVPSIAAYACAQPERVTSLVCFGAYANREDLPETTRRSLIEFVRLNWGLGAQVLASLFVPRASGDRLAELTSYQRRAAKAEAAATFLELDFATDLRALLAQVPVRSLVLHRRGDRVVPIELGREVASLLPNARFVPLAGDSHFPWVGDQRELFRALAGFLTNGVDAESPDESPLTSRETEVLRLVATGLSNREIASSLVLSEHTVHRHIANILRKLTLSSRAAAAAYAARTGLL